MGLNWIPCSRHGLTPFGVKTLSDSYPRLHRGLFTFKPSGLAALLPHSFASFASLA